jgi:hypothetical protein
VYIPSYGVAFEYHGEYHYHGQHPKYPSYRKSEGKFSNASDVSFVQDGHPDQRAAIDQTKIYLCQQAGITLIEVPYWWNRQPETLAATLVLHRPDLEHQITATMATDSGGVDIITSMGPTVLPLPVDSRAVAGDTYVPAMTKFSSATSMFKILTCLSFLSKYLYNCCRGKKTTTGSLDPNQVGLVDRSNSLVILFSLRYV